MRTTWTFQSAGQILFGLNAIEQLGERGRQLGLGRVLLVTDSILESAGLAARVMAPLHEAGIVVEVFNGGEPEPSFVVAEKCLKRARVFQPDGLVALGGGSNMDLAKIVAVVFRHGGQPGDYVGDSRIPGPITPLICVPTTAGTGSEVSGSSVLTDSVKKTKVGVLSPHLRPLLALIDPTLMISCPPRVTADSGIDALTHAIEAYTAIDNEAFLLPAGERTMYQGRHPFGDMIAEKAIGLCGQHLRQAVSHGSHLVAREGMALAATLGGLAFSNVGVALVHAMEYPLGGTTPFSHGAVNGLLLPYVMRFNLPARPAQFASIGRLLGESVAGLSDRDAGEKAIEAIERLKADIGIPLRLRDIGVRLEQLKDHAAKAASIQRILRVNPRPVSVQDVERIFQEAY